MDVSKTTKANSYCINPSTNRPVRIGGKKWRDLVSSNTISPQEEHDNVVYRIKSNEFSTDKEAINHLQKEKEKIITEIRAGKHDVPTNTNLVRKGTTKLVYQRVKLTINEIVDKSVEAACHVIDEIRQGSLEIDEDYSIGRRQAFISNAIIARMAAPPVYSHIPPMMRTIPRLGTASSNREAPVASLPAAFETDSEWYSSESDSD